MVSMFSTQQSETPTAPAAATDVALVVTAAVAMAMLSCGRTRLYQLIQSGELESFLDGRSRRITKASIVGYIKRKIEESRKSAA
jgi:excisionase family DNA binding protein